MKDDFVHSITESSCFFQGHVGQFFTQYFGKSLSFRITYNYDDINSGNDFNSVKYRPVFSKIINRKISLRKQAGGNIHEISPNDIQIKVIKLIDDVNDEGISGRFQISPPTALCTKDGCNQYFELKNGRKCGHKDTDPWEQFTFLAFCDECGRLLPLHYMTNINNDCNKCGGKASLTKLKWAKKDNISSYKIVCRKCGDINDLYFYKCNHENGVLSDRPHKRFRGVPARAGAIVHPFVISIPDISKNDTDRFGKKNTQETLLSESFTYFFGYDVEESKLNLPEFKNALIEEEKFWGLTKVRDVFEEVCDDLNLDLTDYSELNQNQFSKALNRILKFARSRIEDGGSEIETKINEQYGIGYIEKSLKSLKDIEFGENELQCSNLLDSTNSEKKEEPTCKPIDYKKRLDKFGLKKAVHYSDITMIQAFLGIIEGSTRRDPVLFRTIETGKKNHTKPTVFVRNYSTEGILFQLDFKKILQWLHENRIQIGTSRNILPSVSTDQYTHFRYLLLNDDNCKNAVKKLLPGCPKTPQISQIFTFTYNISHKFCILVFNCISP